jgi:BCD family chlorophyll transporter-like MFS transporter
MNDRAAPPLGWVGIVRLGLVQAALGSVVVLVTSTLNRVMVVEYALPAVLPGLLVALHYAIQFIRPRFGYGSDRGGRCSPWIVGGMAVLAAGGFLCAVATVVLASRPALGLCLAIAAYSLVGLGVGAAGTSLLVLVAKRVDDGNRAAAATVVWVLMIAGFAVTSSVVGQFLDPFSPARLIEVVGTSVSIAFVISLLAVWRVERSPGAKPAADATSLVAPGAAAQKDAAQKDAARNDASRNDASRNDSARDAAVARNAAAPRAAASGSAVSRAVERSRRARSFASSLRLIWSEPQSRSFTVFVFVSMLAYSAQELLLEPYAGLLLGYTLGQSARLSGLWHASVLVGMILVAVACSGRRRYVSLRACTILGCCGSAAAVLGLLCAGLAGPRWPLQVPVIALGLSNGVFAVAAIGSMMQLAHQGEPGNAGVRMGLWGAAQAVGFAAGGLIATSTLDAARLALGSPSAAFALVFGAESALFLLAAWYAAQVGAIDRPSRSTHSTAVTV